MIKKLVALANKYQIVVALICFLIVIATVMGFWMNFVENNPLSPEWTNHINSENTNCNLCLAQFPQTNCTVNSTSRACEALKDYCSENCTRIVQ